MTWEPTTAPLMYQPDDMLEPVDGDGESMEFANTSPMFCRRTPHHCWYVDMGMELAALIRRWLARPVLENGSYMTVLDELFQSQISERSLQDVVATSLRQVRRALEKSSSPGAQAQAEVPAPLPVNEENSVAAGRSEKPTRRVRTRSQGVQTIHRHSRIVPLMSVRCQRPQGGLLGPVPGSLQWARNYCRELLAQTRRR